jgi:hypothetical protein
MATSPSPALLARQLEEIDHVLHDRLVVPLPVGYDRRGDGSPHPKLRRQHRCSL